MVLKNLLPGQQQRNRQREQTYGREERGGESEMYGKSNRETYPTMCKVDSEQEFAVWLGQLEQGLCVSLEGWDGEEGGKEYVYTYG